MAKQAKLKGNFYILDDSGKNQEINKPIEHVVSTTELTHIIQIISAGAVDEQIAFAGVTRAKAVYIDPGTVSTAIEVKFEVNTNTAIKVDAPCVFFGEVTAVFISVPGTSDVTVEVILAGE